MYDTAGIDMTIGHGRMIELETAPVSRSPIPMQLIIARFSRLLDMGDTRKFSNEFLEYFFPLHQYTQHQLEDAFIGILIGIHQHAPESIGSDYEIMREEILEICAYELNYQRAVNEIIEVFLRLFGETPAETTLSTDTIYAMVHYIDEHYREDLRIEDIAAHYHYNSSYFSRVFRKTIGMAPSQYITNRRMDEAKRLLIAHPEYTIGEIAAACGYEDTHYFSRLFKQITALSPSTFREQNTGKGD